MTRISSILDRKGADVATVQPDATLLQAARLLTERGIGSLVVSADGRTMDGIISERDIVRQVAESGAECLSEQVADLMTVDVVTCERHATVDDLMTTMTERRVRHIPVMEDDRLVGVVSIGDVVKSRLVELEVERNALESYVSEGR